MKLKEGTLLQGGRYRIDRVLGQGGFGITYLGEHVMLGNKLAIKEFFMKDLCNRDAETSGVSVGSEGSREIVERFRMKFIKEARSIYRLKHKHIIHVIDVFEENGTAYYVMEYIGGGSLADKVRTGVLPETDAVRYIRQVASALEYVHSKSVMHLDVKPANILLDEKDNAVLIDFGLAKQYDNEGHQTSTTPVGISHGYAPLEQYRRGGVSTFSPATDIYSLGATLYKLVTGLTPPEASDVNDDGLPPMPETISVAVREAIEKAMQPRRKERPQSIAEFLFLLDSYYNVSDMEDVECTLVNAVNNDENVQSVSIDKGLVNDKQQNPFNWKILAGILFSILCIIFIVVLFYNNNNSKEEQQYALHQDSIALAEQQKREYLNEVVKGMKEAEQRHLDSIAIAEKIRTDSLLLVAKYQLVEQRRRDSIAAVFAERELQARRKDSIARLPGELYVNTNPAGATVTLDGKQKIGTTPISAYKLKKGKYTIQISKDGYKPISMNVKISSEPSVINEVLAKNVYPKLPALETSMSSNHSKPAASLKHVTSATVVDISSGTPEAINHLAYCYMYGSKEYNITQNRTEAVKLFRKAAELGNSYAQGNLAVCYLFGEGVQKDYYEAVKWLHKAASQGYDDAQNNLGVCYERGFGVTSNSYEAFKWYRMAAEKNNADAQYNLAVCYEYGYGVAKSIDNAVNWYKKSERAEAKAALKRLGR